MDDEVLSGLRDEAKLAPDELDEEEEALVKEMRDFFVAFVKTIRSAQLYVRGNPIVHQFMEDLGNRLRSVWDRLSSVSFTIYESEIRWRNSPVYAQKLGAQENLAFQLYRDGIRRIEFLPGIEEEELRQFIEVLRLSKLLKGEEDDLLTLLWNNDFRFIRYEYVDALGEEAPVADVDFKEQAGTQLPTLPELELSPEVQTPTLREDFEPSLYFLDETEVAHLQQELRREWDRPTKRDVVTAVLDQFEMGDEERRGEIFRALQQMLPRVLAEGSFDLAAFILLELKSVVERKQNPEAASQVDSIISELSQPIVLEQLIRVLEDETVEPSSESLATLFSALRPEALVSLVRALQTVVRPKARELLSATLDRLATANEEAIASLVRSEDPQVAVEAVRIVGRLKMASAVDAVGSLLKRPEPELRLVAVEALIEMRTSRAGAPLLAALEDESRDVRVAAARGVAELKYSPGAKRLEQYITSKVMQKTDLTEQLAFFEAYARAAGQKGAQLLRRLLNGRRFLWFRYPTEVRACAARALGIVGGADAEKALTAAERDRDPMVMSAVHAARRQPGQGSSNERG